MQKYIRNTGKPWAPQDEKKLTQPANKNTPMRVIGLELGRSENGIRSKASELEIS